MHHCGIYDFRQLGRITLNQYRLMKKAITLQSLDKERDLHWQAWLNAVVQNTRKHGKTIEPVFKTFDSFFQPEKLDSERVERPGDAGMKSLLLQANRKK